jgi:hypothetical protein
MITSLEMNNGAGSVELLAARLIHPAAACSATRPDAETSLPILLLLAQVTSRMDFTDYCILSGRLVRALCGSTSTSRRLCCYSNYLSTGR